MSGGDLRAVSQALEAEAEAGQPPSASASASASDLNIERIASSSSYDPVTDKGKRPLRNMTDVYVSGFFYFFTFADRKKKN